MVRHVKHAAMRHVVAMFKGRMLARHPTHTGVLELLRPLPLGWTLHAIRDSFGGVFTVISARWFDAAGIRTESTSPRLRAVHACRAKTLH